MNKDHATIDDYAVIGDCRSAALVSRDASIDWLCWPCFDSPSIFAAMISPEDGGCWQICPVGEFTSTRKYVAATNVLQTRFETSSGSVQITDFMPVGDEHFSSTHLAPDREIIRLVEGLSGQVEMRMRFEPKPEFSKAIPTIRDKKRLGLIVDFPGSCLRLQSPVEFRIEPVGATSAIVVNAGDKIPFFLSFDTEAPSVLRCIDEWPSTLSRTIDWWRAWSDKSTYDGPFREAVLRSVLTLKLMHFAPSGAIVAAVTTSLPEEVGGQKNYDYRYCWLRDASLAIHALCGTGYESEAEAFVHWMLTATRLTQPKLMVMYDIYGRVAPEEKNLLWLTGYRNSLPVRIGNVARSQVQMDTYGEVVCAAARLYKGKGELDRETAKTLVNFGKYVCDHWKEPDAGIWEPRGKPVLHTHSLLLCWVALDELIKLNEGGEIVHLPVERLKSTRAEIRSFIESNSWNMAIDSYASEPGSDKMDATLLLMAFHKFHEASSKRLMGTSKRVHGELGAGGSLLYRNRDRGSNVIDAPASEGAFGICGFWAVEHIAMGSGTLEEAERCFQNLLEYANDVGLFAEETDPESGAALGNFPQAFTHVGLVSAALAIERRRESNQKEFNAPCDQLVIGAQS